MIFFFHTASASRKSYFSVMTHLWSHREHCWCWKVGLIPWSWRWVVQRASVHTDMKICLCSIQFSQFWLHISICILCILKFSFMASKVSLFVSWLINEYMASWIYKIRCVGIAWISEGSFYFLCWFGFSHVEIVQEKKDKKNNHTMMTKWTLSSNISMFGRLWLSIYYILMFFPKTIYVFHKALG